MKQNETISLNLNEYDGDKTIFSYLTKIANKLDNNIDKDLFYMVNKHEPTARKLYELVKLVNDNGGTSDVTIKMTSSNNGAIAVIGIDVHFDHYYDDMKYILLKTEPVLKPDIVDEFVSKGITTDKCWNIDISISIDISMVSAMEKPYDMVLSMRRVNEVYHKCWLDDLHPDDKFKVIEEFIRSKI